MSTQACIALQNEPLTWMRTNHGDGYALGWKGDSSLRQKAYNLFCNFHQPPNHGNSPQCLEVGDDISYIYLSTLAYIKPALSLYFYVNAVSGGEVPVNKKWNEESCEFDSFDYDEEAAKQLADESADVFIKTIKHVDFIHPSPKIQGSEYGMGYFSVSQTSWVEDLASATSS